MVEYAYAASLYSPNINVITEKKEQKMTYKNIELVIVSGIATLTLNRPKSLNSLNAETMAELLEAVDCVQKSEEARVLMITGAGRAFLCRAGPWRSSYEFYRW